MGLDLIVEGKAKPGYEAEWRQFIEKHVDGGAPTEAEKERFQEISIPPYTTIGAPRVGFDQAANDWLINKLNLSDPDKIVQKIEENKGYYALDLVGPPACPRYCNAIFGSVDETSFRGAFLSDCEELLGEQLLNQAWGNMWPEEALAYGQTLLQIAEAAEAERQALALKGIRRQFQSEIDHETDPIDILRSAGDWYVFWGKRGHPITAWF